MSCFGQRLKRLRQQRGLTQEELAMELAHLGCQGITKSAISQYENNKRLPVTKILIIMCDYLKVSIDYLLRGEQLTCTYFELDTKSKALADAYIAALLDMNKK